MKIKNGGEHDRNMRTLFHPEKNHHNFAISINKWNKLSSEGINIF